jgi:hypothetical protein
MEYCDALRDMLLQLEHVLKHAPGVDTYRFDSGPNMATPWIGFNINDMEFFFFLSLNAPELLTLQRFRGGVDPNSFDGSLGELDRRSDGIVRWRTTLDLADARVGYFEADRAEQVQIITRFFEDGFRYGLALRSQLTAAAG